MGEDQGSTQETETEIKDIRISDKDIEFLKNLKQTKELEDKLRQQPPQPQPPQPPAEVKKLQKEVDELRAAERQGLLSALDEKEQEEYKEYTNDQLKLVLEVKKKYAPKGVRRAPPSADGLADESTTVPGVDAGSIGFYDYKTQTWKHKK